MGFWDNILKFPTGTNWFSPRVTYIGGPGLDDLAEIAGLDPTKLTASQMWRTQPHFRTVVTFVARNIAHLGLHSFERVSDTDRKRDRSSPLARALAEVDGTMTRYELIYALVIDILLYDKAYWWAAESSAMPSGFMLRRLPPAWVQETRRNPFEVSGYELHFDAGKSVKVPVDSVLAFPGFNPSQMNGCSPTVDSLRETLREQIEASRYRGQVWKRGGRVSSVIERPRPPQDAAEWSDAARNTFREDWYSKFTGNGPRAGGTPILEDGMTLKRVDFSASEQQFVEAAKLSMTTVAAAFHVNPTMVGQMDNANYSNVREFRKMLYGDTLGPYIAQIEERINTFLIPRLGMDPARFYVEFNIAEKLQGSFEEQAAAMQTAVGGPWMTRAEARGLQNLPELDGADELIVPLNVLVGGQASPSDAGTQNLSAALPPAVKARQGGPVEDKHVEVLRSFFARQGKVVRSRVGAKADWWDGKRWDAELTETLAKLHLLAATASGKAALDALGVDPAAYDEPRTVPFLLTAAGLSAKSINEVTKTAVSEALSAAEPGVAVGDVFVSAQETRAPQMAATAVTFASAFGAIEAGKQQSPGGTKTWVVNSSNPRPSHAKMSGETVSLDSTFSNGMDWPGSGGSADEVAGCKCSVTVQTN